jgi:histone deacetylase complex regulatory component SIN3
MIIMPIHPDTAMPPQSAAPPAEESHDAKTPESVSSEAQQPAADEAAQSDNENMKNNTTAAAAATTNGANGHPSAADKPALELALEQIETTKTALRTVREGLSTLADTLKQVQREQKTSDKEVQSVRSTLERLQSLKL